VGAYDNKPDDTDPKYKGYAPSVNPIYGTPQKNLQIAYDELKGK
jgi:hypothetical protein